jgi:hypothetical protein
MRHDSSKWFGACESESELPTVPQLWTAALVLLICAAIVGGAIYGISKSEFWTVAPVILKRAL